MRLAILIPVYQPAPEFEELVHRLTRSPFQRIVIINDGSDPEHRPVFSKLSKLANVDVLGHATNPGKGAALKTGFNYVYCRYPELRGVVTFDADGQHDPEDAIKVGKAIIDDPSKLVLGVREFGKAVPFRSRCGNRLARVLLRALAGLDLKIRKQVYEVSRGT